MKKFLEEDRKDRYREWRDLWIFSTYGRQNFRNRHVCDTEVLKKQ